MSSSTADGGAAPVGADVVSVEAASAQVAAILRREIQRGDHRPGSRLRQRDVAARLGVSTTPVREAFQTLVGERYLVLESHRGATVVQPSITDLTEDYAIRASLEGLAIRTASERPDRTELQALRTLLDRMRKAPAKGEWAALDNEFHHRLYAMAAMPRLLQLIDTLRWGVEFYIEAAFEDQLVRRHADHDHAELLDAVARGDGETAARIVAEHLDHVAGVVIRSLEDDRRPTDRSA